MKMTIWTLSTCIPGDAAPCAPEVFGTKAEADAAFDQTMREEWARAEYEAPYPGPDTAHDVLSAANEDADPGEEWGGYRIDQVAIEVPDPPRATGIGVTIEDGLVSSVFSDCPESCPPVYIIDYDVEQRDPKDEEVWPVHQGGGDFLDAVAYEADMIDHTNGSFFRSLYAGITCHNEGGDAEAVKAASINAWKED